MYTSNINQQHNSTFPVSTLSVSVNVENELKRVSKGKRIRCKLKAVDSIGEDSRFFKSFTKFQQNEFDRCTSEKLDIKSGISRHSFKKFLIGETVSRIAFIEAAKAFSIAKNHSEKFDLYDISHLVSCLYTSLENSNLKIEIECDSFVMIQKITQNFHHMAAEISELSIGFNQLGQPFSKFSEQFVALESESAVFELYSKLDDDKRSLYAVELMNLPEFNSDPQFDLPQNYRTHLVLSINSENHVQAEIGISVIS